VAPMELREYWAILRRRWWIPVAFGLAALIVSTVVGVRGATAFRTDMRIAVSTQPTTDPNLEKYYDPIYYSNLDSEYLADDLSEFLHSDAFAQEVSAELARERGLRLDITGIANATRTRKTHRFIDLTIMSPTAEEGSEIAGSVSRLLADPNRLAVYLKALDAYKSNLSVVVPPNTRRANTPLGLASEIGLRTLIGLFVGIALAFLRDYLDTSVRTRREAEDLLQLRVLGEVPRSRRGVAA
jgi:capsular polysaccharide biosynthesis protein